MRCCGADWGDDHPKRLTRRSATRHQGVSHPDENLRGGDGHSAHHTAQFSWRMELYGQAWTTIGRPCLGQLYTLFFNSPLGCKVLGCRILQPNTCKTVLAEEGQQC